MSIVYNPRLGHYIILKIEVKKVVKKKASRLVHTKYLSSSLTAVMSRLVATSVSTVDQPVDLQTSVYRPPSDYVVTIPYNKTELVLQTPYSWMQVQIQYINYRNKTKNKTIVLPRGRSLIQTIDWPRKQNTSIKIKSMFYYNRVNPLESHLPQLLTYMPRTTRDRQVAYVYIVNPRDAITYREYLIRNLQDSGMM
jgi:hypothetical protein